MQTIFGSLHIPFSDGKLQGDEIILNLYQQLRFDIIVKNDTYMSPDIVSPVNSGLKNRTHFEMFV